MFSVFDLIYTFKFLLSKHPIVFSQILCKGDFSETINPMFPNEFLRIAVKL